MSSENQMLLFEKIPYLVRRPDQEHFKVNEIENFLIQASSENFIGVNEISSVYVDNKYNNQHIDVETYKGFTSDNDEITVTWGDIPDGDGDPLWVCLHFIETDILPPSNIIKKACEELKVSQGDLAYLLGVKEQSIRNMISKNKFTTQIQSSINLLLENDKLRQELKECSSFKKSLQYFMKSTPQTNKSNQETSQ